MNENINLCEILKGHEGEIFYSPVIGYVTLQNINTLLNNYPLWFVDNKNRNISFTYDGRYFVNCDNTECIIFPSKDQRDWNKWIEEQKSKVPKTWSDIKEEKRFQGNACIVANKEALIETPIIKSANAFLKIYQLIEIGYGGNVTNEEWNGINSYVSIQYYTNKHDIDICLNTYNKTNIAFHTKEQAKEFLSYPENVQLLKDYFMI